MNPITQGLSVVGGNVTSPALQKPAPVSLNVPYNYGLPSFSNHPAQPAQNAGLSLAGYQPSVNTPPVQVTQTGGTAFDPAKAAGFKAAPVATQQPTTLARPNLNSFINGSQTTAGGGTLSTTGGSPTGYSPGGFSIDTKNPVPSSSLSSNTSMGDVMQQHSQYQDYVNSLAQAEGYSPQYIQAYQAQQQAQLQQAQINSNLYTGNLPGDTVSYAQGETAKAQAQNTLQAAEAGINLQTQALARQGSIAGAQALVQAAQPVGVAPGTSLVSPLTGQSQYSGLGGLIGVNGINSVNTLSNQDPGAGILPTDSIEAAQQKVANSPAYRAQFLSTYQTPGGGTGLYDKTNVNTLQQNGDGTISLVSGAAAALGSAQASSLSSQIDSYNKLAVPYKAANDDFTAMTQFMQSAGINQSEVPIVNQLQNAVNAKTLAPGAIAAFQTYIQSLRANYTQLLGAKGETPTDAGKAANQLIPENLNIAQMQQVKSALDINGGNTLSATGQQIAQITQGLQTQTQSTTIGNGANPFDAQAFFSR